MSGDLGHRLKTALGETRLLILGAQILFGFHLNAAFQDGFSQLAPSSRWLHSFAFLNMACAVALLITPSLQHRIVEGGHASARILRVTTGFADWALLPFAIGLGTDLYIVVGYRFGATWGTWVGTGVALIAFLMWYGAEWALRLRNRQEREIMPTEKATPLDERIEHMLTEARVLIPGAQALFGFQLAILLTDGFGRLPDSSKMVHLVALCCISVAVILLMATAAFHRISFGGQNSESFHRLGSGLVIAAAAPLACGIVGDLYVAVTLGVESQRIGIVSAGTVGLGLFLLWFGTPFWLRTASAGKRKGFGRAR
jgi:thiosulfate reductase cytochrome b subunit